MPAADVDAQPVAGSRLVGGRRADHDRQAGVDGVAVEDAGERGGHDARHAGRLDGHRRVLARAAAAEVLGGDDDVARLHALDEPGVDVLHAVGAELGGVARVQVARRDDDVGVDVAPEPVDRAFEDHDRPPASDRLRRRRRPPSRAWRCARRSPRRPPRTGSPGRPRCRGGPCGRRSCGWSWTRSARPAASTPM